MENINYDQICTILGDLYLRTNIEVLKLRQENKIMSFHLQEKDKEIQGLKDAAAKARDINS